MSKNVPPIEGRHIHEFIDSELESVREERETEEELKQNNKDVFEINFWKVLKEMINRDVCCNAHQFYELIRDPVIEDFLPYYLKKVKAERNLNFDEHNLRERLLAGETLIPFEKQSEVRQLVTLINSFRLECNNCLNNECQFRDPECPVREVTTKAFKSAFSRPKKSSK